MDMKSLDFRPEMPGLRVPISFMVDDPAPCINPLYYFERQVRKADAPAIKGVPIVREIPVDFLDRFVEVVRRWEAKGKFTLLPYPAGLGSIEEGLEGFGKGEVRRFVAETRDELGPYFDITPEILTHTLALDIKSGKLLEVSEHDWSQSQDRETLAGYIGKALRILRNVGIDATGVTSPCNFGIRVEEIYAEAISLAQEEIYGRTFTWYFLHTEGESLPVRPRFTYLDREAGRGVVSVVSGCGDLLWGTMEIRETGEEYISSLADRYISEDGKEGRLVELLENGSYVVFHTHWQSLFSNGTEAGLKALDEVLSRIHRAFGGRVVWMKCGELARYFAAAETVEAKAELGVDGVYLHLKTPFPCPGFTLSLALKEIEEVEVIGRKVLKEVVKEGWLEEGTWRMREGRVYICLDLEREATIALKEKRG